MLMRSGSAAGEVVRSLGQRDALVEAVEPLLVGLVLDDDAHVLEVAREFVRDAVERLGDERLELRGAHATTSRRPAARVVNRR